jgi:hypothetical protein
MVNMMTLKHPMYSSDKYLEIRGTIEHRVMEDLYSYVYGHYVMQARYSKDNVSPVIIIASSSSKGPMTTLCHKLTDHERIIHKASLKFRHLPHLYHPKDKVSILVEMVKGIDNDLQKLGIILCCDDLIPIVSKVVMYNLDILPQAEIRLVFDYLENSCNEDAYVATVVLSSLQDCFRNLKNQPKLSKTPDPDKGVILNSQFPSSHSCPRLSY